MRTEIIKGIEHTHQDDYLAAPFDAQIEHLLFDIITEKIITHQIMDVREKEKRNRRLRKNRIITQCWVPALYKPQTVKGDPS